MNLRKNIAVILTLLTFCMILLADSEEAGMAFLKMPVSADAGATMSVFSSNSGSPLALFENPLGIQTDKSKLSFSHSFWFADVNNDLFGFSLPLKRGTISSGLNFVRIPEIEVRNTPTENPLATIEGQYFSGSVGYCLDIVSKFSVGVSAKYLYEKLYTESAHGTAFDFGIKWQAPSSLDVSFLLKNVGFMGELEQTNTKLPTTFQIGIIRPEIFVEGPLNASVGLNFGSNLITGKTEACVGAEASIKDILSIRAGYKQAGNINNKSLGFGLNIKKIKLDYAILFLSEGLNYPHIFTINYIIGK